MQDPSKPAYAITQSAQDPVAASYLAGAFDPNRDAAARNDRYQAPQDVQLTFTPEQALELQELAIDYQRALHPNTPLDQINDNSILRQVAQAESADEVAALLAKPHGSTNIAEELLALSIAYQRPLPGTLQVQEAP